MSEDYQSKLDKVCRQVEDGDLSIEEGMRQSNALTAKMATETATEQVTEQFQSTLQEREAQDLQQQFLDDHPDFKGLKDSGKLNPYKEQYGGLHDDFSAYFAYKAEHPVAEEEESPGAEVEQTSKPQTPLSDNEVEASMLAAMKGAGER